MNRALRSCGSGGPVRVTPSLQRPNAYRAPVRPPDDSEVLQIAFNVTIAPKTEPDWPGRHRWWHTHTESPALHHLSRPVLERLFITPRPK